MQRLRRKACLLAVIDGECGLQAADADGWVKSNATGVEMQTTGDNKLTIRLSARPETQARLPLARNEIVSWNLCRREPFPSSIGSWRSSRRSSSRVLPAS